MARLATRENDAADVKRHRIAGGRLERFYGHLEQTLLSTGFIRSSIRAGDGAVRRLFTRARPESGELNILREVLASIEQQNKASNPR